MVGATSSEDFSSFSIRLELWTIAVLPLQPV